MLSNHVPELEELMQGHQVKAGTSVGFKLADVICPDFEQIVEQMGPELNVVGQVAFISDNGLEKGRFAIIDVPGIHAPMIVPLDRLSMKDEAGGEAGMATQRSAEVI